ncbi:unnamed protein product [Pseudo-nitzschia multistriata]|uniref:Uncharacterized protein n=1 Tax=Pseudo-nitzschia multistriata TaxID=183589 RepID=A0A448ZGR7_9STRA|nr:unnamed protein product [Pseudo-nitzschia multistriata]
MVLSKKDSNRCVLLFLLGAGAIGVQSFSPNSALVSGTRGTQQPKPQFRLLRQGTAAETFGTELAAAKSSGEGGKKKRRRKRKKTAPKAEDPSPSTDSVVASQTAVPEAAPGSMDAAGADDADVMDIKDVASFSFGGKSPIDAAPQQIPEEAVAAPPAELSSPVQEVDGSIPLPDIKDTMRRKQAEVQKGPAKDEDSIMPKTKIDRGDRQALLKLLEQDPYADGDDSFFQEEEYTTVSALLGERAKPFLGIPIGPLQVGHTIGALVIILMAFIEYPGFPLTNLPTPIRDALQGGLGTIYGINALLAVVASFKAGERGQPAPLWMAKTFTVGGLALDQLTQLPTTAQIEAAKARKGKRALKNMKRK